MKVKSSRFKKLMLAQLALTMGAMMAVTPGINAYAASFPCEGEVWGTNATTVDEAVETAIEVANEMVAEGQVLLKNNGALPMKGNEWVTMLSTSGASASSKYVEGVENAGFKVFASSTKDPKNYTDKEKRQHEASDVAIIMLKTGHSAKGDAYQSMPGQSLSPGEGGSVAALTEVDDNKDANGNTYTYEDGVEFEHKYQPESKETGDAYKTSLQLTEADEEIIKYATENFEKVVVMLLNGSPSEVGILQANEDIDAILLTGSLGSHGYDQIGKVLNGEVNPSGKTVDLWAWDITGRPSWFNDGNANNIFNSAKVEAEYGYTNMSQTGAFRTGELDENGYYAYYDRVDHTAADISPYIYTTMYEEDIYTGYRYYETAAAEAAQGNYDGFVYNHEVLYPFGYGLSYTEFAWEVVGQDISDWGKQQNAAGYEGTMTVKVKVTNVGGVAGKDVVQIYGHAPYYMNGVAKAEHELIGFEKTSLLKPGQSEVVEITVNIQDLAAYDYLDTNSNGYATYELDKNAATDTAGHALHDSTGKYELRVMKNSHEYGNGEDMVVELPELKEDIILSEDDYTGNTVENLFSGDDINSTLSWDPATDKNLVEEGKMTLLSRANFVATWPQASVAQDLIRSKEYFEMVTQFAEYNGENYNTYHKLVYGTTATSEDNSQFAWAVSEAEFQGEALFNGINLNETYGTKAWTQRAEDANLAELQASSDWIWFNDMLGVDYRNGGAELEKWNKFMNQLTYQEMIEWITNGGRRTSAINSIDKKACEYVDATQQFNSSNNFGWGTTYISCRTWNKDLAYKRGLAVAEIGLFDGKEAYYAPAVNLHRSPYGGRNDEYWSEDGFLSGHMAGNMLAGVQSTGMTCTIKHFALNENENMRQSLHTYLTEQAMRELYLPAFQITIQEYNSWGVMTAYNCIGDTHAAASYNFNKRLLENEWGFDGFNITDAADAWKDFYTDDMALRVGCNQFLCDWSASKSYDPINGKANVKLYPTGKYDAATNKVYVEPATAGNALKTENTPAKDGYVADYSVVSYTSWYSLRVAVMKALFTEVNSSIGNNGIRLSNFKGATLAEAVQAEEYNANVALEGVEADYEVTGGALPEGLEISNGKITGTASEAGTFNFTVKLNSGNYITTTAQFTLTVASAFEMDTATDNLEVGKEFSAYIESEKVVVGEKYSEVKYSVSEGALPAGLTLDAEKGEIAGTPTEAGTYTVTFQIAAKEASSNNNNNQGGARPFGPPGGGNSAKTVNYTYTVTFVVKGEEVVAPSWTENVPYIGENGNWFINGEDLGVAAQGPAGENGQNGVDGTNGQDGKDGKDILETVGCASSAAIGAVALIAMLAAVPVLNRKRED